MEPDITSILAEFAKMGSIPFIMAIIIYKQDKKLDEKDVTIGLLQTKVQDTLEKCINSINQSASQVDKNTEQTRLYNQTISDLPNLFARAFDQLAQLGSMKDKIDSLPDKFRDILNGWKP